jgi:dipeptidyl aminopeptidase/acylaminoacyl peptidase
VLTSGPFSAGPPSWSADGSRILFLSDRRPEPWFGLEAAVLYAVAAGRETPAGTDELEVVLDHGGGISSFVAHADGRLATLGSLKPPTPRSHMVSRLLVTGAASGAVRDAAPGCPDEFGGAINSDQHPPRGGGATPLAFSDRGTSVCAALARHGAAVLARVELESGAVTPLTPPERDLIAGTASADGRLWALTLGTTHRPGDLVLLDTASGTLTVLWAPNEEVFAGLSLGAVEEFWYPSFDDKKIRPGWSSRPVRPGEEISAGARDPRRAAHRIRSRLLPRVPSPRGRRLPGAYTNPRGSTTYGEAFADCIQYRFRRRRADRWPGSRRWWRAGAWTRRGSASPAGAAAGS